MTLAVTVEGLVISIHTLHTEGDEIDKLSAAAEKDISIHTLHTEGDGYPI